MNRFVYALLVLVAVAFVTFSQVPQLTTVQIVGNAGKPSCDAAARGVVWVTRSASNSPDFAEVCVKAGNDNYQWRKMQSQTLTEGLGSDLSSATTITPTNEIHKVTGTVTISTITVPTNADSGETVKLIPKGLFLTDTLGNISLGSVAVLERTLILTWDGTKWCPSY